MKVQNSYTKEFKDSTVELALNSEKSVLKIGKDLGVNPKRIYNWIREYKKANNIKVDGRRKVEKGSSSESIEEENRRLKAENKLLKQERVY